jgi:hypothetical protein
VLGLALRLKSRLHAGLLLAITTLAVAVLAGALLLAYPAGRNDTLHGTISSRLVLTEAGLRMFAGAPLFGIGVGQFYPRSAEVVGPRLKDIAGSPRENAHNNFIQVLAEQGLVGLAALLLTVGTLLSRTIATEHANSIPARRWLAIAIVCTMMTWLTGHPLLTAEFALIFWFACGLLAGTLPGAGPGALRAVAVGGALVIVATLPLRVADARQRADLEHQAIGLSQWQHDDIQRYREGGRAFAVFVVGDQGAAVLPLRRAPGAPDMAVTFSVRGNEVRTLRLTDDRWQDVLFSFPDGRRRFERVDVAVSPMEPTDARAARVRVGRAR